MRIGLLAIDSKIPNLALMKISAWHKSQGDQVEIFNPLWQYDKVYISKIFTTSLDYNYEIQTDEVIRGGSGYDLTTVLPDEIEHINPDYSLFGCDSAMGFLTRGCVRQCEFCIVPRKEGKIRLHSNINEFWHGQRYILLLDNNLTASPQFIDICNQLVETKSYINFCQGLDIRLITPQYAQALRQIKIWKTLRFAWDDINIEDKVMRGLDYLFKAGFKPYQLTFYILIGFNTTPDQDLYRVETLRKLGVNPFIMPFNKSDPYQNKFARWVNHKAIFKTVEWEQYH